MKKMLYRFIFSTLLAGLCLPKVWAQDSMEEIRRNLASSLNQVVRLHNDRVDWLMGAAIPIPGFTYRIR